MATMGRRPKMHPKAGFRMYLPFNAFIQSVLVSYRAFGSIFLRIHLTNAVEIFCKSIFDFSEIIKWIDLKCYVDDRQLMEIKVCSLHENTKISRVRLVSFK